MMVPTKSSPLLLFVTFYTVKYNCVPIGSCCNQRRYSCTSIIYSIGKNNDTVHNYDEPSLSSNWRRRTAKRRQRTEELLDYVEEGGLPLLTHINDPSEVPVMKSSFLHSEITPTLHIPSSSVIHWDTIHPNLDPTQGGKISHRRGLRKRGQIQAFHFILSTILDAYYHSTDGGVGVTIIDAGCGAGNLAIALAGLLHFPINNANNSIGMNLNILAVDVNDEALNRLSQRIIAQSKTENTQQYYLPLQTTTTTLTTCCADLADYEYIKSHIPPHHDVIVVSLHACGAASDMAMNLAYQCNNAPFVICPCCTAKSLTRRNINVMSKEDDIMNKTDEKRLQQQQFLVNPQASHYRSGATPDIQYPRSYWLRSKLMSLSSSSPPTATDSHVDDGFVLLAKVADVGLGPQTPTQQREQQRRAKRIIEMDRLMSASERPSHGYDTRLMRIDDQDDDPRVYSYGKGEVLLGALKGSVAANVLTRLPSSWR